MGPLMIDFEGADLREGEARLLRHPAIGGVILFTRNYDSPAQVRRLVAAIRAAAAREILIAIDQEGGRVQRMREGFSALPPARVLGQLHDDEPARAVDCARARGRLLAMELGAVDIDFSFAPVVDLDYGKSAVIGDRALHGDPRIVSDLAQAFVQGAHVAGMSCVAKHFPGHGGVEADSHEETPIDDRDYAALRVDMQPFERVVDADVGAIMTAHVQYSAVDSVTPCYSRRWLQGELRERIGFGGVVFADDLSMHGAGQAGGLPERVAASLDAGCDMLLVCNDAEGVGRLLKGWRHTADAGRAERLARLKRRTRH